MAEPVRSLVSAEPLEPDRPGQYRYKLTCSCGTDDDLTFEEFHIAGGQMSYMCRGCETPHWFPVTPLAEDGSDE